MIYTESEQIKSVFYQISNILKELILLKIDLTKMTYLLQDDQVTNMKCCYIFLFFLFLKYYVCWDLKGCTIQKTCPRAKTLKLLFRSKDVTTRLLRFLLWPFYAINK